MSASYCALLVLVKATRGVGTSVSPIVFSLIPRGQANLARLTRRGRRPRRPSAWPQSLSFLWSSARSASPRAIPRAAGASPESGSMFTFQTRARVRWGDPISPVSFTGRVRLPFVQQCSENCTWLYRWTHLTPGERWSTFHHSPVSQPHPECLDKAMAEERGVSITSHLLHAGGWFLNSPSDSASAGGLLVHTPSR